MVRDGELKPDTASAGEDGRVGKRAVARRVEVAARVRLGADELLREVVARLRSVPWYVAMSAEDRAGLGDVAGRAIAGFADWLESVDRDPVARFVFADVPPRMTGVVGLDQTVELVHLMTSVGEQVAPGLGGPEHEEWTRLEMMRFSRDLALSLASIYARAAEWRGSVDARLEANLFHLMMSRAPDKELLAAGAALGWDHAHGATAVVGALHAPRDTTAQDISAHLRRRGLQALVGLHGDQVVLLVGSFDRCRQAAEVIAVLCEGPIVIGERAESLLAGPDSVDVALAAAAAAPMLAECPPVVDAAELLPERALLGDQRAHAVLVEEIHAHLSSAGHHIVETLSTFLDCGGSIEKTARRLHLHTNTVRYRLRQVVDESGYDPRSPRDAVVLRTALALGRRSLSSPRPRG